MCPKDPIVLLKVSNIGTGVREVVANKEWAVTLPQMLQDRGPCTIRVIHGRISGDNNNYDVSKVWAESNIPIIGSSTEVLNGNGSAQFTELFDVNCTDIGLSDSTTFSAVTRNIRFMMNEPQSFRCGGLPNVIQFTAKAMTASGTLIAPTISYLDSFFSLYSPQVEFHLSIIFDRDV